MICRCASASVDMPGKEVVPEVIVSVTTSSPGTFIYL